MMMVTLLTGEVTRDGGRLGGLDGGRDPAEGVPATFHFHFNIFPTCLRCILEKYLFVRRNLGRPAGLPQGEPCGVVLLLLLPLGNGFICICICICICILGGTMFVWSIREMENGAGDI